MKYNGAQKGRYKGPETCHWYEVEAEKVLYIDNRDRVRMLGLKDAFDRHIFEGL